MLPGFGKSPDTPLLEVMMLGFSQMQRFTQKRRER
jgi:hypothetical protein